MCGPLNEVQRSKETRTTRVQITNEKLNETMRRLLKVKITGMECNNKTPTSLRDREIMERFESNIEQEGDRHYKVMLPWNSKKHLLKSNYAQAKVRLEQIERKLKREPALQKEYHDVLPASMQTKWNKWLQDVTELEQVAVPRCYFSSLPDSKEKEIHAFCDASQNAYAGLIYFRAVTPSGIAHALLVMAKTRVAPLKTTTIPRLELNGPLIAARLCSYVKQVLKYIIQRTICWTDSSAALHWVRGPSGQ